jgi:hypothetical protein
MEISQDQANSKEKCGHSPHIPQLAYLKEPTPVFPKRFGSRAPFGFEK